MNGSSDVNVARVVERFFENRRGGRRSSLDAVLDELGIVADRQRTRDAAARWIAVETRSRGPSARSSVAAESGVRVEVAGEFPELEEYDLVDVVGRGGMGIVYEAYQRATGRRVAVKFMRDPAGAGEAGRRRFEREVELIARLQHPSIVPVVDSGVHRGRYYYVMDYVEGRPLDECGTRNAECGMRAAGHSPQSEIRNPKSASRDALSAVLGRFAEVCDAVDYAHQRGVLHRDLKPSNILIDDQDRPHVLDFGLAKAIDPVSADSGATLSEPGQLLGTLAYMSPEQSRGLSGAGSVRSDVYSLGAILYELLTGSPPVSVHGPLADVLVRITEQDPPRPSTIRPGLDPDLDAIALKSLDKEAARRYATAADLAADVRRHLANEPITARPIGPGGRALRWVRRHRTVAAVAGAAFAVVASIAGVAVWQVVTAGGKTRRAERNVSLQQAARRDTLVRIIATFDPGLSGNRLSMDEFFQHVRREAEVGLDDVPDFDLLMQLEQIRAAGGDLATAERGLRRMLDEQAARPDGGDPLVAGELRVYLGFVLKQLGRPDEAESLYREALAAHAELLGAEHVRTMTTLNYLGQLLSDRGDCGEALPMLRRVLDVRVQSRGPDDELVANARNNLAGVYVCLGDYDTAETLYDEALAYYRGLGPPRVLLVVRCLNNVAALLHDTQQYDRSEARAREALALLGDLPRPPPFDRAASLMYLGRCRMARGDAAGAEPYLREVLELCERHLPPGWATARAERDLGRCLAELDRFEDAERLLLRSDRTLAETGHPHRSSTCDALIELYERWNRPDEAERQRAIRATLPE